VAQSELITGGMDAEYGNASSAIINYTTKSGGRNFEGNFRYTTDDYGRADKTFTNYDRFSLGLAARRRSRTSLTTFPARQRSKTARC
jgi:hypothetical protein